MEYYQYKVRVYDDLECEERTKAGVVSGSDIKEAFAEMASYYGGQNIMNIYQFKFISTSTIEFLKDSSTLPEYFEEG